MGGKSPRVVEKTVFIGWVSENPNSRTSDQVRADMEQTGEWPLGGDIPKQTNKNRNKLVFLIANKHHQLLATVEHNHPDLHIGDTERYLSCLRVEKPAEVRSCYRIERLRASRIFSLLIRTCFGKRQKYQVLSHWHSSKLRGKHFFTFDQPTSEV